MSDRLTRIYVAGAMRDPDSLQFLSNLRAGIVMSVRLIQCGYAVFSPFLDLQFWLSAAVPPSLQQIQAHSMAWLEVADAVVVVTETAYQLSTGAGSEIDRATELGIPVYYGMPPCGIKPPHRGADES